MRVNFILNGHFMQKQHHVTGGKFCRLKKQKDTIDVDLNTRLSTQYMQILSFPCSQYKTIKLWGILSFPT